MINPFRSAMPPLLLALALQVLPICGTTHAAENTADLIRQLTYQSQRPAKQAFLLGLSTCGDREDDRAIARALLANGASAVPDIEKALGSLSREGELSRFAPNAGLLIFVYSRLRGPAALPRLRAMMGNPRLRFLRAELDRSIAASLALTSYVSADRMPARVFHCGRSDEPRDALDLLILAWERHDRLWLDASLGPHGKAVLGMLTEGQDQGRRRARLWLGTTGGVVGVGYRLEMPGVWSQAEDLLSRPHPLGAGFPPSISLLAQFVNGAGGSCGDFQVKFQISSPDAGLAHLAVTVDNDDLGELLHLIEACASQTGSRR
jgi:hypothetical protein